jgi:4a-hydroxytetrahydrobiopterin dehydratase
LEVLTPLSEGEIAELSKEVPGWHIKGGRLEREFKFAGFDEAMDFVGKVARLAREQDHHPDIFISYNKVVLTFFTHKAGALTKKDFATASKIDEAIT